ncbi:Gfo/Idh/MocA family protein [Ohtaekwangia koreensis]|uniref:Tat (Twin-arginine translocation) pathway signal sequence n=1 Tax=Ohtaekwangia koreensis TaxID=688867 RepID=A0A1T5JM61_9BACT|nr:Gfo/Idh/MocA family oxidoreductase [Ohtaekwangia koreensis]SKC52647.1 Tat (twin-arginine translocation) pathway signal sequence [Ohtaekwangia koreensis]
MPLKKSTPPTTDLSRRNFIKNAGMTAAAFTILPRFVLGGKGYRAPSDTLYVAGIGAGGKGESDIANFAKSGKAQISYLCDVDDRRAAKSVAAFPKAKYYKDFRAMLDKEHKHIDAVSVSTPDHNHAIQALAAMQLGKHVYVQKPLTHDIYEARTLTEAAKKYKVVTQMGNQGASGDDVRKLMEWYNAGLLGDVHTVYCWTNRPVWPQGIEWSTQKKEVPKELDWNLWLGTAPYKEYVDKLVPFNWRGWWDYGTGALGDMGCHIIEPPFRVLGLQYPTDVTASVGSVYVDEFKRGYFPESCPPSSYIVLTFPGRNGKPPVKLHWMDGGIQPERPEELDPNERMGDGGNGALFIGTKGKMMCGTYGMYPSLLPTSKNKEVNIPQTIKRVPGGADGHYAQWVEACLAGYGKMEVSSPFEIAGPLTETVLMGNLAIRSHDVRYPKKDDPNQFDYPGRNIKLLWDGANMKITNFEDANQFVKREYRKGW